jgi:hypothetical protein
VIRQVAPAGAPDFAIPGAVAPPSDIGVELVLTKSKAMCGGPPPCAEPSWTWRNLNV